MNGIRKNRTNQSGFVTLEFVAGVALLLLPVAILVMTLPSWWERADMARVASREAAQEYVLTGSKTQAQDVVTQIQTDYALSNGTITLDALSPTDINGKQNGDANPTTLRGGFVTAKVTTHIPLLRIPIVNIDAGDFDYTFSHTEPIDAYRSTS